MENTLEAIASKTSEAAKQVLMLTPFEIGYFAGILAENHPMMAQQLAIAIKLNLDEIYGGKYAID